MLSNSLCGSERINEERSLFASEFLKLEVFSAARRHLMTAAMTLLHPLPVPYRAGPEHEIPFPSLPSGSFFSETFTVTPAVPRKAFDVFQEKLKELDVEQFPYRLPSRPADFVSAPWKKKPLKPRTELRARDELMDEKKMIMEWRDSPWYKECTWSDEFDQLQYKLVKAKKRLRLQTIYHQFESLNLCNEEITEVGTQLVVLKALKTLSLADNRLRTLDMSILPSGLKHLELYGNAITTLRGFCPKNLQHLGLALNRISTPCLLFASSDLRSLTSLDLGENLITKIDECVVCVQQFPQLYNLRVAGNPISLIRSYRVHLVNAVRPRLLCLDGEEVSDEDRHHYLNMANSYDSFTSSVLAAQQCILLFTIDDIVGAAQPHGYKPPTDQSVYPLTKWAYTVEISFPGCLLPTKPALPPPTPEQLKAKEKAKKAKAAKADKKGHHSRTPTPPTEAIPEPEDPFYSGIPGMSKVTNDGFDWTWADPLVIGIPVPLLVAGDKPTAVLYEYLRRGMKVKIFLKRVVYTPVTIGKKGAAKSKLPKGQKPDLWAVPLSLEVADSVEMIEFTIPLIQLLHGALEVKYQSVIAQPPQMPAPASLGMGKNKTGHLPVADKGKEGKSRSSHHAKTAEEYPVAKGPMVINIRVKIHHDQSPADLSTFPPEIPPYNAPEPSKPIDARSYNSTTPKSVSPEQK